MSYKLSQMVLFGGHSHFSFSLNKTTFCSIWTIFHKFGTSPIISHPISNFKSWNFWRCFKSGVFLSFILLLSFPWWQECTCFVIDVLKCNSSVFWVERNTWRIVIVIISYSRNRISNLHKLISQAIFVTTSTNLTQKRLIRHIIQLMIISHLPCCFFSSFSICFYYSSRRFIKSFYLFIHVGVVSFVKTIEFNVGPVFTWV